MARIRTARPPRDLDPPVEKMNGAAELGETMACWWLRREAAALLAVDEEGEGDEERWPAQSREEANGEDEGIGKDEGRRRWCWGRARRAAGM